MTFSQKISGCLERLSRYLKEISNSKLRFVLLLLSGILTGITIVFPEIGFIQWLTIVPAGVIMLTRCASKEIKLCSLYLDGLVFFYSYYVVCYHWFVNLYPLEFIEGMTKLAALAVVLVAIFGLSLLQAIMGAAVFFVAGLVFRSRLFQKIGAGILLPFAAAGLWAVFEWLQTFGWWGVPWGRLPLAHTKYLVGLQNASWFGPYFVTFMIVAVNLLIAYALLNPPKMHLGVLVAVCFLVFQYGSGALIWFTTDVEEGQKITVACVQGNVSSNEKWDSSSLKKTLDNYVGYTKKAAEQGAELVVWPETAFPYDISENGDFDMYADYFANLAEESGVYILVGTFTSSEEKEDFNSIVCFTPKGEKLDTVYVKRRLVPFGEFVPMRPVIEALIPPLAELIMSGGDVTAGEGSQIMELENGISVGSLICFDSIYEELTLESVRDGAEILCLSTNDSWFTDSRALNIHNSQAQLRAIESGRYIARAANTGISTGINSRGEVLTSLEPLVDGMIVFDAYANERITVWTVIGNTFVYILALCFFVQLAYEFVYFIVKNVKKNKNTEK